MTSAAETDVPQAYPPSAEFAAAANAGPELQAAADTDRLAFWANQAERLHWHEKWTDVLDWTTPPSPSGSSAENSTSPTTASTATSSPATATASPFTSKANQAIPGI